MDRPAPQAVRIREVAHATSAVEASGHLVGAAGPLLAAPARTSVCPDRKHSGLDTVLERLRTVVAAAGARGETVTQLASLEKRRNQMAYPPKLQNHASHPNFLRLSAVCRMG